MYHSAGDFNLYPSFGGDAYNAYDHYANSTSRYVSNPINTAPISYSSYVAPAAPSAARHVGYSRRSRGGAISDPVVPFNYSALSAFHTPQFVYSPAFERTAMVSHTAYGRASAQSSLPSSTFLSSGTIAPVSNGALPVSRSSAYAARTTGSAANSTATHISKFARAPATSIPGSVAPQQSSSTRWPTTTIPPPSAAAFSSSGVSSALSSVIPQAAYPSRSSASPALPQTSNSRAPPTASVPTSTRTAPQRSSAQPHSTATHSSANAPPAPSSGAKSSDTYTGDPTTDYAIYQARLAQYERDMVAYKAKYPGAPVDTPSNGTQSIVGSGAPSGGGVASAPAQAPTGGVTVTREARASHVLVATHEEAMALRAQIKRGAVFNQLARQHSLCGSGREGGTLDWFGRGIMAPEFENLGVCHGPIRTNFGYHLIVVHDRR